MRLLLFISVLGILVSIGVLIIVIIKAKNDATPPKVKKNPKDEE